MSPGVCGQADGSALRERAVARYDVGVGVGRAHKQGIGAGGSKGTIGVARNAPHRTLVPLISRLHNVDMDEPGTDIPRLERLMRDVLRSTCEEAAGPLWLGTLSRSVADAVNGAAGRAATQRPDERLDDAWEAAGLAEIRALLRSWWPRIGAQLSPVWNELAEMQVDLDRLLAYRGKSLHAVGPVNYENQRTEARAIITRLRIGFEEVRRQRLPDDLEWLPYLERIESPIEGLCWSRTTGSREWPTVRQGDRIDIRLIGVNPAGDQDRLQYDIEITGVLGDKPAVERNGPNEFFFDAPRSKQFIVGCYVRDRDDPRMYDGQSVVARVVPQRLFRESGRA